MLDFYILKNETAVAIHSGAMETRDHLKNGAKPKSHISRINKKIGGYYETTW